MKSVLILSLILSSAAYAQRGDLGSEAQQVANEVQLASRTLTRDQIQKIYGKLQDIRAILAGNYNGGGGGGYYPSANFVCVSRDNDGRDPWVFGVRNGINISRVNGTTFSTSQDCQSSLTSLRSIAGTVLGCVARDNDGRNPWQIGLFDSAGTMTKVARSVTNSLVDCQDLTRRLLLNYNASTVTYCTSRDNDGRSPYTAVNLDLRSGAAQAGSESFQNINDCWGFLGVRP